MIERTIQLWQGSFFRRKFMLSISKSHGLLVFILKRVILNCVPTSTHLHLPHFTSILTFHSSPPTFHSTPPTFHSAPPTSTYLPLTSTHLHSHLYKTHQKKMCIKRCRFLKNNTSHLRDSYTLSFSRQVPVNAEWDWMSMMEWFELLKWSFSYNAILPRDSQTCTIVLNKPLKRKFSGMK